MEAVVTGGAGFLVAVLWFDLMFDVQVRGHSGAELPEPVLASIAGYYARVTTQARPMNRLVSLGMIATIGGVVAEIVGDSVAAWVGPTSALLAVVPIGLAGARVFPDAVRLGRRTDDAATQSALARGIYRRHLLCLACMSALLLVQAVSVAS